MIVLVIALLDKACDGVDLASTDVFRLGLEGLARDPYELLSILIIEGSLGLLGHILPEMRAESLQTGNILILIVEVAALVNGELPIDRLVQVEQIVLYF